MITLHITIATIIFSVMFAYRNYWQIQETSYKEYPEPIYLVLKTLDARKKWHNWQFALQIYIGVIIAFVSFVSDFSALNSLGHGLLFGSVFWLVFDTLLGYLLTKNIFHVDSNGIGTFYRNITFKIIYYTWKYTKIKNEFRKPIALSKKGEKLAQYLLFISKVLFFALSVIISLI